jgi:hypothetical protein
MCLSGQAGVHACCVRDVTTFGAGIRLNGLKMVPLDFDISFDNFRTIRKCRLIWRGAIYGSAAYHLVSALFHNNVLRPRGAGAAHQCTAPTQ